MSERASLSHSPCNLPRLHPFPRRAPYACAMHVAGRAPGAARGELWQEVFGAKGLTCRRRVREPARRAEAARARPQLLVARPARGAFAALAKKRAVLTRVARTVGAAAPEAAERARSGSAAQCPGLAVNAAQDANVAYRCKAR